MPPPDAFAFDALFSYLIVGAALMILGMLGFLASQPLPNLEIVQGRAEEWEAREAFDVVTGRALAPLAIQLELSAGLARIGGAVIPMRTERPSAPPSTRTHSWSVE